MRTRAGIAARLVTLLLTCAVLLTTPLQHASAAPPTLRDCAKLKDMSTACAKAWTDRKCEQSQARPGEGDPCADYALMAVEQCQKNPALFTTDAVCR
jgi:hypothetical protein